MYICLCLCSYTHTEILLCAHILETPAILPWLRAQLALGCFPKAVWPAPMLQDPWSSETKGQSQGHPWDS